MSNQLSSTKIKEIRMVDRPREVLALRGKENLRLEEIMALLIGSGSPNCSAIDLSKEILQSIEFDLVKLGRFNQFDFMKFKGIGLAKASLLVAALELGRRRMEFRSQQTIQKITCSQDAFFILQAQLVDLPHEEFWFLHLNRGSRLIKMERLSIGGVSGTLVDVRLVIKSALEHRSSSLILAHNHPSGNLQPSQSDRSITYNTKIIIVSQTRVYFKWGFIFLAPCKFFEVLHLQRWRWQIK
jgi:DNA repair protein RadC